MPRSGSVARSTSNRITNAPTRYYAIETDANRRLNSRNQDHIRLQLDQRRRPLFAGRLANYLYIDMDDCMRQALDTADDVLAPVQTAITG